MGRRCGGRDGACDECIRLGRRSRVVLTPRRWRQVLRKLPQDDGDKKARSPGRARRNPLKPLRGECRANRRDRGYYARVLFIFARETTGASSARHSLRPLSGRKVFLASTRAESRHGESRGVSALRSSFRGARQREPGIHSSGRSCGAMDSGPAPFGASQNDEGGG